MTRIFILAGQSNMEGLADVTLLPAVLKRCPDSVRLYEEDNWKPLLWRPHFGPEVSLAHSLSARYPNESIVLCKLARGGTNLTYDWNPDGVSFGQEDDYRGPLFPQLLASLSNLEKRLAENKESVEISAFFWMQGERDAVFRSMSESYEANLSGFISAVRTAFANRTLPIIIGEIAPKVYRIEDRRFQHEFRDIVRKAQRSVARKDSLVSLVRTMDLPQSDNLHFDAGGQLELGSRMARAFFRLREG